MIEVGFKLIAAACFASSILAIGNGAFAQSSGGVSGFAPPSQPQTPPAELKGPGKSAMPTVDPESRASGRLESRCADRRTLRGAPAQSEGRSGLERGGSR